MGLFSKIKNMFKSDEAKNEKLVSNEELDKAKGVAETLVSLDEDANSFGIEEINEENSLVSDDKENEKILGNDEVREDDVEEDKFSNNDVDSSDEETVQEVEVNLDLGKDSKKEKKGFFGKRKREEEKKAVKVYEKGLTKSREGFVSRLANLTNKYSKINDEYFEELEEILIMADIGVNTVMDFMDRLRSRVSSEHITDPNDLKEIIVDELFIIYVNDEVLSNKIIRREGGPTIILFVGVNGVGKTTTIGKLANKFKDEGDKVLLVGADTFRAGAVPQLREWSEKVGVGFFGRENSDPASVVYDGIELAKKDQYDMVLIDTAGRLQNKVNLMRELEKINKVIDGLVDGGANETLLVIDATTGQNGVSQAKAFKEITNITGIVLTKLDGTAKGGIVLAIKESVGVPVKYIGLGEGKDDLQVFDIEKYIYGLFKDMM